MRKTQSKKRINIILSIAVAVVLLLGSFSFLSMLMPSLSAARADFISPYHNFVSLTPTEVPLENSGFDSMDGLSPSAPAGWSEASFPIAGHGDAVMGVLDIMQYERDHEVVEATRLRDFPEFAVDAPIPLPRDLIGMDTTADRFLMINTTKNAETALGLQSPDIILAPNSQFRISVWAKTGEFTTVQGAAIRINGIHDRDIAFNNVRTTQNRTALNRFGWEQFTFYIKTDIQMQQINLALSVGDFYRGYNRPDGEFVSIFNTASGYAFFDEVLIHEISPSHFNDIYQNRPTGTHTKFVDLTDTRTPVPYDPITGAEIDLSFTPTAGTSSPANYRLTSSVVDSGVQVSDVVPSFVLNSTLPVSQRNRHNLPARPIHPFGTAVEDPNILVISSYLQHLGEWGDEGKYTSTVAGFEATSNINIPRFSFYKLSFWVNTHHIEGTAGASAVITTNVIDPQSPQDEFDRPNYISFAKRGLSGSDTAGGRYGWTQHSFFIQGSLFSDYTINLGFWLGQEGSRASGTALFSNVGFYEITSSEFLEASFGGAGTIVTIDGPMPTSNVPNGNFTIHDGVNTEDDTPVFPLSVAAWNINNPATIERMPFSNDISFAANLINSQGENPFVISGLIPTDVNRFNEFRQYFGSRAIRPNTSNPTVLYMHASRPVAFNYTSEHIPLSEESPIRISVSMKVDNVIGYGASIVLLNETGVISSIQNITSTNGEFQEFSFFVGGNELGDMLTIEIWLGLYERAIHNRTKLSTGDIYIESVNSEEISFSDFANAERQFLVLQTAEPFTQRPRIDWVEAFALNNNDAGSQSLIELQNSLPVRPSRSFAVINMGGFGFNDFDIYDDNFLRMPASWTISGPPRAPLAGITSGIFDAARLGQRFSVIGEGENQQLVPLRPGDTGVHTRPNVPGSFINRNLIDEDGNIHRNNTLMLSHENPTASELQFIRPLHLEADSFYRLEFSIKADIPEFRYNERGERVVNGIGAGLRITDDFYIDGISSSTQRIGDRDVVVRDTATVTDMIVDNDAFRTYSFYIFTGDEGRTITLTMFMGGESVPDRTQGRVYLNHIALESINNVEFIETISETTEDTDNIVLAWFGAPPRDQVTGEEDGIGRQPGLNTFVLPMILFSVAIILVVILVIGRRIIVNLRAKRAGKTAGKGKGGRPKKAKYDRTTEATTPSEGTGYLDYTAIDGGVKAIDDDEALASFDDEKFVLKAESRKVKRKKARGEFVEEKVEVEEDKSAIAYEFEDGFEDD